METDEKIQKTMARAFNGRTLLCIAHRLMTIVGYDRIVVMDQGKIAELDTPARLYAAGGIFRSMCDKGGIRAEDIEERMEEIQKAAGESQNVSGSATPLRKD